MTQLNFFNNVTRCNSSLLGIDQACITLISASEKNLQLSAQSEECYSCDYKPWCTLRALENVSFTIDTRFPILLRYSFNVSKWCLRNVTFKEYGVYGWNISDEVCSDLYIIEEPTGQFLPLIVAVTQLIIFTLLSYSFSFVVKSRWFTSLGRKSVFSSEREKELGSPNPGDAPPIMINEVPQNKCQRERVVSLDVFRGLCIALMIFIHAGGGGYWFSQYAQWNGLLAGNLPIPLFLWIMGMGLAISLRTQLRSSKPKLYVIAQVLRRSFILIGIGVIFNNRWATTDIKTLKLTGVLQTLGVCYMVIGMIEILLSREGSVSYGRWVVLSDIIESWRQWLVVLALAGAHVGISLALPVPGCPRGYLGPGGWHMHGRYAKCGGGAARYIDNLILTPKHMLTSYTWYIYHSRKGNDVCGILPTLSKVLIVYLGVHAGRIMQCYNNHFSRINRWFLWGLLTGIIAGILCNFSKEDGIIPVNWTLSSLSFILATASMAFILLSILYFVVDCHHWWSGSPFIYAGRNSLLLYIGHSIALHYFPWTWKPFYNNHAELLARDIWTTTLWLIIAYYMYRRNFFVTV